MPYKKAHFTVNNSLQDFFCKNIIGFNIEQKYLVQCGRVNLWYKKKCIKSLLTLFSRQRGDNQIVGKPRECSSTRRNLLDHDSRDTFPDELLNRRMEKN